MAYWGNMLGPRAMPRAILHNASMKYTLALSNTPGPVKAWWVQNDKGEKSYARWCQSYVMVAGRIGINVSCMSYDNTFKVTVLADDGICQDSRMLVDMIQKNIEDEIKRMKDVPVPDDQKQVTPKEKKDN